MEDIKYKIVTLQELQYLINDDKPVMFDTETIGLYGKIRLAQFYQVDWDCVYMLEYPTPLELVSLLTKLHIVMHNAHYDITCIQDGLGKLAWVPEKFDCTFLLSRLYFYKEEGFSFDKVVQYVLDFNPYEELDKKEQQKSDWSTPVLSKEQLTYAAADVIYLQQVYDVVKEMEEDLNYRLDIFMTRYCLDFQNNGLPFEENKLNDQYTKNMLRIQEINLPINCNSYQQTRKYINSTMSDDLGLATLSNQGCEKAKAVRETRKLTKQNSFLTKFLNTAIDGCIYGKFKCSPRSGRTASDDQNLQQLPRTTKGIFGIDPEGDTVIIYSDFAQIQLRAVCVVTGDKTMEDLFRSGADLHNYVAKMIFGENFTKRDRQISKTANFGLLFGAGVNTFRSILLKSAGLDLSEEEATKIKKKWLSLWTAITAWQKEGIKAWKRNQAWETPLGRRYTARMMTDQLAMQIQGFEAEVAKLATHYMVPKLKELCPDIKIRNFVHDSYVLTAPNDPKIYQAACEIIADSMQEAWHEMCQSVKITDLPMPTSVRVGFNWGDIEEDKFIYELIKD